MQSWWSEFSKLDPQLGLTPVNKFIRTSPEDKFVDLMLLNAGKMTKLIGPTVRPYTNYMIFNYFLRYIIT